ncbi:MAG: YbaK/EbsC family protein [Propionibacteriaceae bacterium]|jgi:prolyl-tRNA editing enzyme YbaK/EbsC (Cys-tRNA(Pro) deacylase)|nr:YbaK/EbsC family protein [Propionibacteriaceae bacterium]
MSFERARAHLAGLGLEGRIRRLGVSSATVELAAEALGCAPAVIAKSLTFSTPGGPILVVAAGDARVDNKRYKDRFGCKARMIGADQVEQLIGHAVGGVCPFGVNPEVAVHLDASLARFERVFPACGSSSSMVELTIPELELASGNVDWVEVTTVPSSDPAD